MKINSMCIYDLDGTLDLTDSTLSAELLRLSKNGTIFVVATGRANSYVNDTCKKYGILPPRYIIGDNGGTIYDNIEKKYIKKTTLQTDVRTMILDKYLELGEKLENIRYTDGEYVHASEDENVKKYYKEEKSIKHWNPEDLASKITSNETDMTKLTLAGSKRNMQEIMSYIQENNIKCQSDIGATKFPSRGEHNFRLDIMDGSTCKGEAVEFLSNYLGVENFTCIGNGPNDISMFEYALDCDMPIIVVKNNETEEISSESRELIAEVQEYAKKIGRQDNVTIARFPVNGYVGILEKRKCASEGRQKFAMSIKVDLPQIRPETKPQYGQNRPRRTQSRGEKE